MFSWTSYLTSLCLNFLVNKIKIFSSAIKKAECRRIDAFELWYWRRLFRVPWMGSQRIGHAWATEENWTNWRLVQGFVYGSYRVRFVLSFVSLFVFPLIGKGEWDGNPVCWWLGFIFVLFVFLDKVFCTGCYCWLGDAGSCIEVVTFVWVLTIWESLGSVLWKSKIFEFQVEQEQVYSVQSHSLKQGIQTGN